MLRSHLVIVGGGFAGLSLARALKHIPEHDLRITIVSENSTFRYCPALYRVATGHRNGEALIPIHSIIDDLPNAEFIRAKALRIDRKARTITLSGDKVLHYDYAVLALGVVTSYFNIAGLEENSYGIKTPHDLIQLRRHLHQSLVDDNMPDANYIVVGGGPTGVELAAALLSYMRIVKKRHHLPHGKVNVAVIEAAARPVPMLPAAASRRIAKRLRTLGVHLKTDAKVEAESETSLQVSGKSIPTKTVIWTAGVTNNPFYQHNADQFTLNERGKVVVDKFLKVDSHTFVIGDNAATPFSGLALTAVHDAHYVSRHIKAALKKRNYTHTYKPLVPIAIIPAGKGWSLVTYRNIVFAGRLGAALRRGADFVGYKDIMGWRKAYAAWRQSNDEAEYCALCKASLLRDPNLEQI